MDWIIAFPVLEDSELARTAELSWQETKFGGSPIWPPSVPAMQIPQCSLCGKTSVLLLQAYAPASCIERRILYVFACNSIRCSSDERAWTVLRVVDNTTRSESSTAAESKVSFEDQRQVLRKNNKQPVGSDEEAQSEDEIEHLEHLLRMHTICIQSALETGRNKKVKKIRPSKFAEQESWPRKNTECTASMNVKTASEGEPHWLRTVPLEVDYEDNAVTSNAVGDDHVQMLLNRYLESERTSPDASRDYDAEEEDPESETRKAEQTFYEMNSRIPCQVVRYKRGASPTWPLHPPPERPEPCPCGAERAFELQIMPAALYYLKPDESVGDGQQDAGMNWACAAIYTCTADCLGDHACGKDYNICVEKVRVAPDIF